MNDQEKYLFSYEVLHKFSVRLLKKVGLDNYDCKCVADALLNASTRGVDSHGMLKLHGYIKRYSDMKWSKPEVVMDQGAVALYDGHNYSGFVTSTFAMELAIEKAKKYGAGIVGVKNSGHYGMASHYSMMAAKQEMIGWSFTNAGPLMAPWGAIERLLGINPWSYAAPSKEGFPVVLDISNSIAAYGKVQMAVLTGKEVPSTWALDKNGNTTTDPNAIMDGGLYLPIGDYKGYGISVIVDILCGVLMGASISGDTGSSWNALPGTGHYFGVIDIKRFRSLEDYYASLSELVRRIKNCQKKPGVDTVYIPGEIEHNVSQVRLSEGIPITNELLQDLNDAANFVGEKPLM